MQIITAHQENIDDERLSIIAKSTTLTVVGCIKNNSGPGLTAQSKAQSCGAAFQPCNHRKKKSIVIPQGLITD